MSEEKLQTAREFGATDGVLATLDKPWRAAIKAMGGRLTVESREGMGTRFCVMLPVAEAAGLIAQHSQSDNQTENQEVA